MIVKLGFRSHMLMVISVISAINISCEKDPEIIRIPTISYFEIDGITALSAVGYAEINENVNENVKVDLIATGVVWSTLEKPTIEVNEGIAVDSTGEYFLYKELTELQPNTLYYARAFATNAYGTGYSKQITFTTLNGIIKLSTSEISKIRATTATSGGKIIYNNGSTITTCGMVWNTSSNPTITTNIGISTDYVDVGVFTHNFKGLNYSTTYYLRAYANSSTGTYYGNQIIFKTRDGIIDIDGNVYVISTIGDQVWMSDNLKTTRYNDGTEIPLVTVNTEWSNLTTPAFCWVNNDMTFWYYGEETTAGKVYGALYNWYAVNTDKLCPSGWHAPTDAELYTLENFVDPTINNPNATGWRGTDAGHKLRSTNGWNHTGYTAGDGTDDFGFSAFPSGYREDYGAFSGPGGSNNLWCNTERNSSYAWSRNIYLATGPIARDTCTKNFGFSVRCVKDK